MNLLKKVQRNERGSATIEFLGIVPIAFILLAVIIQFVVGINGVLMAQSAANEYASVYSVTEDSGEAENGAVDIINSTGNYLNMSHTGIDRGYSKDFTASVSVNIRLMFLPDQILGGTVPTIPFTAKASGRVVK